MAQFPATPAVIKWAIEESGYSIPEVAEQIGAGEQLALWLSGSGLPTYGQIDSLAKLLKRPPATFLLPQPPPDERHAIQFRHPPDAEGRHLNPAERVCLRESRRLQKGVSWVLEQLEVSPVQLPKFDTKSDPELAGARLRELLSVREKTQLEIWTNASQAQAGWRHALEATGVLVFLLSMGKESARGFSSWDARAPVVAINTVWNQQARVFSMLHELGHLVTRTDSACIEGAYRHRSGGDPVERWCEQFAASVLMPWKAVERVLEARCGWERGSQITDIGIAAKLSRRFKVSLKAAVLRLITGGLAKWSLFHAVPQNADAKTGGGGGTEGRSRAICRRDEYGERTARVLLEALDRDVLTRGDVLSYLDVGDRDLTELESVLGAA